MPVLGEAGADGVDALWPGPLSAADPALRERLAEVARRVQQRAALAAGAALHRHTRDFGVAMQLSSANSVLFSRRPLAAAGVKRPFAYRQLFWTFVYALGCALAGWSQGGGGIASPLVRLRPRGLADPVLAPNASTVQTFGPLVDGCRVPAAPAVAGPGGFLTVNLSAGPQPRRVPNGYYFLLSDSGPPSADPAGWAVEASDDGGATWGPVGACSWATVSLSPPGLGGLLLPAGGGAARFVDCGDGGMYPAPWESPAAPAARGTEVRVDLRPDLLSTIELSTYYLVPGFTLAMFLVCMAGLGSRLRYVMLSFLAAATTLSACFAAVALRNAQGGPRAAESWLRSAPWLCAFLGVLLYEAAFILVWIAFGVTWILDSLAVFLAVYDARPQDLRRQANIYSGGGVALMVFGAVCYALRWRALRRARRLVAGDAEVYGEIWDAIWRTEGRDCEALGLRIHALRLRPDWLSDGVAPRQLCSQPPGLVPSDSVGPVRACLQSMARFASRRRRVLPGVPDAGCRSDLAPVDSLDQLFVQAAVMEPILIDKVRRWAAASRGRLPRRLGQASARYEARAGGDAGRDAEEAPGLQLSAVKSVQRAVEKVVRSYDQDVSLLVDVCRQCIVFETVRDLRACVDVIAADPDAAVLRVKNRLDPAYDAAVSAGYRDVNVVLRLRTALTGWLGVDGHVCEVQLVPRSVAEVKSAAGHSNYVKFRNLRVE